MNDEENMTPDQKIRALTIASRRATSRDESFEIADQAAASAVAPVSKKLQLNNILSTVGIGVVGTFLLWCMVTLVSVQTAQAQEKAQNEKNTDEIKELKASDADTKSRLATLERLAIRSEVMNEQIVIKLGMIPPPKVTPDGGHP